MKALLEQQARRINALSLRERAILFVSLGVALVAAADALVLSPRMQEQKALASQLRQQAGELDALRAQVAGTGAAESAPARLLRLLQTAQAQQQTLDAEIERRLAAGAAGTRLPDLLERVLRRHDRLTLLRLATAATPPRQAGAAQSLPLQGVDLSLRGAYNDLTQYVAAAEQALPGLRWGELSIVAGADGAAELTARVYLLENLP